MFWIGGHKKYLRAALLVLFLAAIIGPWTFDRIHVLSEYLCSPPNFRLEGDFCGTPLTGIWIIWASASSLVYIIGELVTGAALPSNPASQLFMATFPILLVLPFFSSMLVILRGGGRAQQVFQVAARSAALCLTLLWVISRYPKVYWMLWGTWLYIGLAAIALALEILAWRKGAELAREPES